MGESEPSKREGGMKVSVGCNKQLPENRGGERGASVHIEMDVPDSYYGDGDKLAETIRGLASLAECSINRHLDSHFPPPQGPGSASGPQIRCLYAKAKKLKLN